MEDKHHGALAAEQVETLDEAFDRAFELGAEAAYCAMGVNDSIYHDQFMSTLLKMFPSHKGALTDKYNEGLAIDISNK